MTNFVLTHLADRQLLAALPRLAARDRATTAELLAHLAEVEARRLHSAAGYSSMHAYCVGELLYADDAAAKRIHAARIVRAFPVLYEMLVDGRMSLTTVRLLGGHLDHGDASELIALAAGRSRTQVERLLVERYGAPVEHEDAGSGAGLRTNSGNKQAPEPVPTHVSAAGETPLPGDRVALQLVLSQENYAKLARARDLLGFEVAAGDHEEVLARALDALIVALEKKKFGKYTKHRATASTSTDPRHIPSALREEVAARDAEQCAFVTDDGKRCESRHALQFDHIVPLAQGGATCSDNLRLLCPAHNQYEAERRFGRAFMQKRRQRPLVNHELERREFPDAADVRAALYTLGFRKDQIVTAMDFAAGLPDDMPAEERVREILRLRGARGTRPSPAPAAHP